MRVCGRFVLVGTAALLCLGFACVLFTARERDSPTAADAAQISATLTGEEIPADAVEEEEPAEVKRWVRGTFDAVVITLSVGVIALVWLLIRRVMKKYGGSDRRFG